MRRKNKAPIILIAVSLILISVILGFLTQIMPASFQDAVRQFATNTLCISYEWFWIICLLLVLMVAALLAWLQSRMEKPDHKSGGSIKQGKQSIVNSGNIGEIKNIGEVKYVSNKTEYINYGEKRIRHSLTPDPFIPVEVIGRDKEIVDLRKKLLAGKNFLLLVNGHGGIGKTTLASRYYHQYKHEYQHAAWVLSEKNITAAMLMLALPLGLKFEENSSQANKMKMLLTALANLKKPCLLVIDNVNEQDDLEKNYRALQSCSNFHVLLTSRLNECEDVAQFKVYGLKENYALKLFKKHYPGHNVKKDELLKKVLREIEYNTLVIELLAKNLQEINRMERKYTLEQLYDDVRKNITELRKKKEIKTTYQAGDKSLRHETPDSIVMAMYDLRELTEAEKQMLSVFAALPNEALAFAFLATVLGGEHIEEPLNGLFTKGWLDFNKDDHTFKVNQVVQDVVKQKQAGRIDDDCSLLVKWLANYLQETDELLHKDKIGEALLMLKYAEALSTVMLKPNYNLGRLLQNVGDFLTTTGDLYRAKHSFTQMQQVYAKMLKLDDGDADAKNGLAISYERLGNMHTALGNLDKALKHYEDYSRLEKELYAAHPQNVGFKNGLAISYQNLGITHSALGNLDKALKYYEDYSRLEKELYAAHPQNVSFKNLLAISYQFLGKTHAALGNLDKALKYYELDAELSKELYDAFPQNVSFKNNLAISYQNLGITHSALGNLDKALKYYEDYSRLEKELFDAFPQNVGFKNNLAISYTKLAVFYRDQLKEISEVLPYLTKAKKLWDELCRDAPQYAEFQTNLQRCYDAIKNL